MEKFYEKVDKFEEQLKSIGKDLKEIIASFFVLGVKVTPIRLIAIATILIIPSLRNLVFVTPFLMGKPVLGLIIDLVWFAKEVFQLLFFCMMKEEQLDKDEKISDVLKHIVETTQSLLETILEPFKGLSESIKETKAKKVTLKEESKIVNKVDKTTKEKMFKDDIIEYTKELSDKCDALSPESKKVFLSELKEVIVDYTTKVKEMIQESDDTKISLENEATIHRKALEKLTLIDLKIQKQLVKDGKVKILSDEEKQILSILDKKEDYSLGLKI